MIPRDNRGTEVKLKQTVALNVSGQVGLGEVVAITSTRRYGRPGWLIRVRLKHSIAGQSAGHISKVTDPLNLLVLRPDDL